jgi:hypothetical protein
VLRREKHKTKDKKQNKVKKKKKGFVSPLIVVESCCQLAISFSSYNL